MQLLMTPEGKKVQVNISDDDRLYDAPHNPPNTGTAYTSGTDLYAHTARSGKRYYYTYSWSMWQGTEEFYQLISEEEAKEFALKRAALSGYPGRGVNETNCELLWGDDFFAENA